MQVSPWSKRLDRDNVPGIFRDDERYQYVDLFRGVRLLFTRNAATAGIDIVGVRSRTVIRP